MDERLKRIERIWTQRAASFDREPDHGLHDPRVSAAWARLLHELVPADSIDVLDLGCGTGSLSVLLAASGHRVVGVDLSASMVEQARRKAAHTGVEAEFLIGDASAPPVMAGAWDVVLVRHVVWTLLDPVNAIARWFELLRPGGRLVLIEGRWATEASASDSPLPWGGGVAASQLTAALEVSGEVVDYRPLDGDAVLWGRPVDDERYVIVAVASGPRPPSG